MYFRKSILSTFFFLFFFNDTATTEIYTLSLHDALPISSMSHCTEWIAIGFIVSLLFCLWQHLQMTSFVGPILAKGRSGRWTTRNAIKINFPWINFSHSEFFTSVLHIKHKKLNYLYFGDHNKPDLVCWCLNNCVYVHHYWEMWSRNLSHAVSLLRSNLKMAHILLILPTFHAILVADYWIRQLISMISLIKWPKTIIW